MKTYKQRSQERADIISRSHLIRAFSKEQLEANKDYQEAIKNGEKLYNYCGALITKANYDKMASEQIKSEREFDELSKNDDFLYEAMRYELNNHEFIYDRDFDVFHFLGVRMTPRTLEVYNKAKKDYIDACDI